MPLSFATILGGMITLIGTPPNIIIASFRERASGRTLCACSISRPVGGAVALAGIAFVALIGYRLIPRGNETEARDQLMALEGYLAELVIPEKSKSVGRQVRDLYPDADEDDVAILGG